MNIHAELDAHEVNLVAAGGVEPYITKKQVTALAIMMSQVLPNKKQRIAVLKLITDKAMRRVVGVEATSTKHLTGRMASYLINQLKDRYSDDWSLSEYGRDFLEGAKALLEADTVTATSDT